MEHRRNEDKLRWVFVQNLVAPLLSAGIVSAFVVAAMNYWFMPRAEASETYARKDSLSAEVVRWEQRLSDTKDRVLTEVAGLKGQIAGCATSTDCKYLTQRLDRIDSNLAELRTAIMGVRAAQKDGGVQ